MTTMAEPLRLESGALHEQARTETGLSDFGPRDYEERLDVLLAAIREVQGLDGPGLLNLHSQLLQMLRNRLLLTAYVAQHPDDAPAQPARRRTDVPHPAVLGEHGAAADAGRGRRRGPARTGRPGGR